MKVEMDRPFVCTNVAMTADGKISSTWRQAQKFSSRYDKKMMDRLRADADAVLVGARTLAVDDPPLYVRDPEMQAHRRSLGKPDALVNVVLTASATVDPASRFFSAGPAADRIVATVEDADASRLAALAK